MFSTCVGNPWFEVRRAVLDAFSRSLCDFVRLFAVVVAAATLAGCARSSVLTNTSELPSPMREGRLQNSRHATQQGHAEAPKPKKAALSVIDEHPGQRPAASYGFASFYRDARKTASGETFDPQELTAAHPSLPFGTRLRVTSIATRRSVIVRVNDRGPFVNGRVVDLSYSAAETLGIVERGVAKVKVDVVQ
jgi:rare lipoprotein A